ncbi:MAG TPA: penicillin acylase family protein, partial [Bryobacteraceae bacterium]|nr:penicillin acylase family protein [Bryobacteraceae bacterium]
MTRERLLRYFNIAIFAVLLLAALGVYWAAYRPLPQTSGTLAAPISGKAVIVRDTLGIPHITAATIEDALFLQGYATAQDRLWQMDGLRRLAAGRLAEVFGPAALESDREARRLRIDRIAEVSAANLSPQD